MGSNLIVPVPVLGPKSTINNNSAFSIVPLCTIISNARITNFFLDMDTIDFVGLHENILRI